MLYVNADDLGWTEEITYRILKCYHQRRVHSASAMTFMKDSERAAALALENGLPTGLHLNLTQELSGWNVPENLRNRHGMIVSYLRARKVNQLIFNPFLRNAFDYVFQAQWDEFSRLYGKEPNRVDGHHHMHLCVNMLVSGRLPKGIRIRRNFTFGPGEKNIFNRLYRSLVDRWLRSQFKCIDYFFSLSPIEPDRVQRIVSVAKRADVELMVHPGVEEEYRYLLSEEWGKLIAVDGIVKIVLRNSGSEANRGVDR